MSFNGSCRACVAHIEQFDAGDPINMDFDLLLIDGDFDAAGGALDVTLMPPDQII